MRVLTLRPALFVSQFVEDQVHAPYLVGLVGANQGLACRDGQLFAPTLAHHEAGFAIQPVGAFEIDLPAFIFEPVVQESVAVAAVLPSQNGEAFAYSAVLLNAVAVTLRQVAQYAGAKP